MKLFPFFYCVPLNIIFRVLQKLRLDRQTTLLLVSGIAVFSEISLRLYMNFETLTLNTHCELYRKKNKKPGPNNLSHYNVVLYKKMNVAYCNCFLLKCFRHIQMDFLSIAIPQPLRVKISFITC